VPPKSSEAAAPSGHWLARQLRDIIAVGCLAMVVLPPLASPVPADRFRIGLIGLLFLFCAWAVYWRVVQYLRGEPERQARVSEAARIEGVTLATRTVRHHLGNKLAVAAGYGQLLAEDPRLPHELEEHARRIVSSAFAAVETVDKLQADIVRVQLDDNLAGPPLLDVDACTFVAPHPAP